MAEVNAWFDGEVDGVNAWADGIYGELAPPPDPPTIDFLNPSVSPRTISGTALPNATVQVVIDGAPYQTIAADSYGDWAFGFNAAPGTYTIEVRQQGADSEWSAYTDPVSFVILPDDPPPPSHGHGSGRYIEEKKRPPQEPASVPGGGLLGIPFRRPRAWPSERGD